LNEEDMEILKNSPIAIARLEKVILEAMLTNKISYNKDKWSVLVKEEDVPCAAIAFEDLKQMFNNLTAISEIYSNIKFPEIDLTIISNKYSESKLHINCNKVYNTSNTSIVSNDYDMVLDISMDLISDPQNVQFSEFKALNNCYFNIRSSNEIFSERHIYTTDLINYKSFTIKNAQGYYEPIEDNVKHLRYFLQLLFRKKDFREGQLPILTRALENKSVIGLLPTGGGKSLTYQLSAMLQPGVSIVIDPLISLMMDQYNGLRNNGIDYCTYINGTLIKDEQCRNQDLMEHSQILFIFLSPERLCMNEFRTRVCEICIIYIFISLMV
jgi:superfamily II DNA helicase RecQ